MWKERKQQRWAQPVLAGLPLKSTYTWIPWGYLQPASQQVSMWPPPHLTERPPLKDSRLYASAFLTKSPDVWIFFIIKEKALAYQGNLKPGLASSGGQECTVTGSKDRMGGEGWSQGMACLFEEAGDLQEGSLFMSCKYIPEATPPGI